MKKLWTPEGRKSDEKEIVFSETETLANLLRRHPGAVFHHEAFERGYIMRGKTYGGEYSGKFGRGFVIHWANRGELHRSPSRQYNYISYFIVPEA